MKPPTLEETIFAELATGPKFMSEIVGKCSQASHSVATMLSKLKTMGKITAQKSDDGSGRLQYKLPKSSRATDTERTEEMQPRPRAQADEPVKQFVAPATRPAEPGMSLTQSMVSPGTRLLVEGVGAVIMSEKCLISLTTGMPVYPPAQAVAQAVANAKLILRLRAEVSSTIEL